MLLVVWQSLTPDPQTAPMVLDIKSGHFAAYAWLMFWFAQIHRQGRTRAAIAIALGIMGVALECVQGFTSHRTFAYADMIANVLGITAGWALAATPLGQALDVVELALARLGARKDGTR